MLREHNKNMNGRRWARGFWWGVGHPSRRLFAIGCALPILLRLDGIVLPPDLEQFAAEAVASGRFRDVEDLVRTGVDLVRRRERARAAFVGSLDESLAEGERDGFFSMEEVERDMDAAIAEVVTKTRL